MGERRGPHCSEALTTLPNTNTITIVWQQSVNRVSNNTRQPTRDQLPSLARPIRAARKGSSPLAFQSSMIVSSVQVPALFREHESSHRLLSQRASLLFWSLDYPPVRLCARSLS